MNYKGTQLAQGRDAAKEVLKNDKHSTKNRVGGQSQARRRKELGGAQPS